MPAALLAYAGLVAFLCVASLPLDAAVSITGAAAGFVVVPNGTVGQAYSASLAATGGTPPYTWTALSAPPAGLSFGGSGTLSGIPNSTLSKTTYFQVQVTDSSPTPQTATTLMGLKVNPPPLLIITTASLPNTIVGLSVNQGLQASGGLGPYTWSLLTGGCLTGTGLSLSSGGVLNGAAQMAGQVDCIMQAIDQLGSQAFQRLTLTVSPNVSIIAPTFAPIPVGKPYTLSLLATGGTGGPYTWTLVGGSLAPGLALSAGGTLSGTPSTAGTSSFSIQANDGISKVAQFTATLQVYAALSISTTSLPGGTAGIALTRTLAATGGTGSYTWSAVGSGLNGTGLSLSAGGTLSGSPTAAGTVTFSAKVTDQAGNQDTRALSLSVNAPLSVTSSATLPGTVTGQPYSFSFSAQGGTGGPYTWSLAQGSTAPVGLALSGAGLLQGTPTVAGSSAFTVVVNDGVSPSVPMNATLQVYAALSISTSSLPGGTAGIALTRTLAATGGTGSYTWSTVGSGLNGTGLSLSAGGTLSGSPTAAGTVTFSAKVTDQAGNQDTRTLSLPLNAPLSVTSSATLPGTVTGQPYSFSFSAQGGTGGPYTWSLAQGSTVPAGLALSGAGLLLGTPTVAGSSAFTVVVNDGVSPSSQSNVTLLTYLPLSFTTSAFPPAIQGVAVNHALQAAGGFGTYSWTATGLAGTGLTLSPGGVLAGTPLAAGPIAFSAQVADQVGNRKSQALQLDVTPTLAISAGTAPNRVVGQAYSFQFTALAGTGSPGATVQWSATPSQLPPGLSLSAAGLLQGTPTTPAPYSFTVTAADGVSQPAQKTISLTIYAVLSISSLSLPNGLRGQAYPIISLVANGGAGVFAWSATGLPSGLALSQGGTLGGTPGLIGQFSQIVVTVTDAPSGQTAQQTLILTINAPPLVVSPSAMSLGVAVGQVLNQRFSATGATPPLTWSLASGQLGPGVSISPDGVVSGSAGTTGNFRAGIQVQDSVGVTASATVAIDVLGLASQNNLPRASVNAFFSAPFAAAGGTPPYTFSATNLPGGLSMSASGNLSGFPATAGTFGFTVTVADSAGVGANAAYTLAVTSGGALSITSPSAPDARVGNPYAFALTAVGGILPYRWSTATGALPEGLTLNSGGLISGTPSVSGTFLFRAQVNDNSGGSVNIPLSVVVQASDLRFVTGAQLPAGIVGSDYPPQILNAAGGTAPYTYVITTGSLPGGLALTNGTIAGIPTAAMNSRFSITATDAGGSTAASTFSVTIAPSTLNLIVSAGTLSFAVSAGAGGGLPPSQAIGVQSSQVSQALSYTATATPPAAWLNVAGAGATPGAVDVSLNSAALLLQAGTYQTGIAITCSSITCAGKTQQVAVTLTVTSLPPKLSVETTLLSFSSTPASPSQGPQSLIFRNAGGGALGIASLACQTPWCVVTASPGSVAGGSSATVSVSADPTGLAAGFYQTTVNMTTSAGPATVPVTLFVSAAASAELLPSGAQFSASEGNVPGNSLGSFLVSVSGNAALNWTASVLSGANWLMLNSETGTASPTRGGTIPFSIRPSAASLPAGTYYANVQVTIPGAANSPRNFLVVLNIAPAGDPIRPDPQPAGLLFLAAPGVSLPPQTVQVYASSAAPVPWSASPGPSPGAPGGGSWLTVSPASGTTSSAAPGVSAITANPAGLAPGIYRSGINYALSGSGIRTVNVTLIVPASIVQTSIAQSSPAPAGLLPHAACSPATLAPTQTGLVNNFSAPTAWPTVLAIKLVNDCGASVANGQVVATFSNGDPPLSMSLADSGTGVYSGTWTPRKSSAQITVQARATAPGFPAATTQIAGSVVQNAAPALNPHGTLHSFAPKVGAAVAPGTIVQIYGENLAAQTTVASAIPLPTDIGGTRVLIGGIAAPLYFVSAGQINAQVPFDLDASRQYQILVQANGALTTPDSVQLLAAVPGLAAFGDGRLIAQHQDGSLVTPAAPAKPLEFIVAYLAGMGDTDTPVLSGSGSPSDPLARPAAVPSLELDGKPVRILFAGLTPGLVGLYQLNFQIPAGVNAGNLKLVVTQNESPSNATILPVQP